MGKDLPGLDMEPRVIDWGDIVDLADVTKLVRGDIITGFENLKGLDILATYIGYVITGQHFREDFNPDREFSLSNSGKPVYRGWRTGSRYPSDVMKPPTSWGKFHNISALILEDVGDSESDGRPAGLDEDRGVRLGLFADMVSAGQGVIGKAAKECRIGRTLSDSYGLSCITAKYSNLPGNSAEQAAERLRLESEAVATRVIMHGLRHIYRGGLPELGKR